MIPSKPFKQLGTVLAVSLVMLTVVTLLGVAALNLSTTNLRLAGNTQAEKEVEAALKTAIETFVSSSDPFMRSGGTCNPAPQTVTVQGHAVAVDLDEPFCLSAVAVPGSSTGYTGPLSAPGGQVGKENTTWEIRGTAWDALTGTRIAGRQGIMIPLPAGNCPATLTNNPCP